MGNSSTNRTAINTVNFFAKVDTTSFTLFADANMRLFFNADRPTEHVIGFQDGARDIRRISDNPSKDVGVRYYRFGNDVQFCSKTGQLVSLDRAVQPDGSPFRGRFTQIFEESSRAPSSTDSELDAEPAILVSWDPATGRVTYAKDDAKQQKDECNVMRTYNEMECMSGTGLWDSTPSTFVAVWLTAEVERKEN